MTLPGLYLDEDVQSDALIEALRARGISVFTTSEAGMSNRSDDEQLQFATTQDRVLVTCNVADFARLHTENVSAGREHSGIILVHQQRRSVGELARRMVRLLVAAPDQNMRNRLEFISNW